MFEFNYSQLLKFDVSYCRKNRHGTQIFNLRLQGEGDKGYAFAKIRLNKHQEIQINFTTKNVFGVFFEEDITKKLSEQITVQQLTERIP